MTYLVVKNVNLQVGRKTYRKDAIITAEMVGQDKINRYLARGYIKPIGGAVVEDSDNDTNYLTPGEVDKLRKPELLEYAGKIGVGGINSGNTATELKAAINQFIEEMSEDDSDEDDSDEDTGDEDDNGNGEGGGEV